MRASALAFGFLLVLGACAGPTPKKPVSEQASTLARTPVSFADLPGWGQSSLRPAFQAMATNCAFLEARPQKSSFAGIDRERWTDLCSALARQSDLSEPALRVFFETHFTPFAFTGSDQGFLTGYYEPLLEASRERGGAYQTPLWQKPKDMITADLGAFDASLKGKKITGKVSQNRLVPYDSREQIAQGSLKGRAEPLFFAKDPLSAFFLEIQGSGLVALPSGETLRVSYDGQNGHAYTAIGKTLLQRGALESPVTMPKIRAWLQAHPDQAQSVMNKNESFVFFKINEDAAPKGALGVSLTANGSLAVDPAFAPLGSVFWIAPQRDVSPRLVVAQDTGGAIKGPARGDLFLGAGMDAENLAGRLQSPCSFFLLWPNEP